jgi:branched-chain amino acid transport system ATP-binding protein
MLPNGAAMLNGERPRLRADDIHVRFGGVTALSGVSVDLRRGEILALIGPNGAGKTTLINTIGGVHPPAAGRIFLDGQDITGRSPDRVARLGIARTFQNVSLFGGMTVLENVLVGRHIHMRDGVLAAGIYWGWGEREELRHRAAAERIIDFLEISHIRRSPAGALPYGLRKRVDLGRALAAEPSVLLLDEPMTGMNREEKEDMVRFILDIRDEWAPAIALIEHDMGVVMDISHRVVVLDHGGTIAEGTPDEVRTNARVLRAYLGEASLVRTAGERVR